MLLLFVLLPLVNFSILVIAGSLMTTKTLSNYVIVSRVTSLILVVSLFKEIVSAVTTKTLAGT